MYLIAAAKRSEQGRLLHFVRVADYLVSGGLREVLDGTLNDVLQKVAHAEVVDLESEVKVILGQIGSIPGQVPEVLMEQSATSDESLPDDKPVGRGQLFVVELVMEMDSLIFLPTNSMFDYQVQFQTDK